MRLHQPVGNHQVVIILNEKFEPFIDGARAGNGMASYSGVLDAEGADAIRAFLIKEANDALPPANRPQ